MLRSGSRLAVVVFAALVVAVPGASLARPESDPVVRLPGLEKPARVLRDGFGVPHVYAAADRDAWFLNGYLHAQDRFFQMDLQRRRASGTLAELLGAGPGDSVLGGDVTLRTLGLRRAAERSLAAYPPSVRAVLDAYANGVNLALSRDPLPPEYAALGIAAVPTWTPLDSVAIAKLLAFGLSFDDGDLRNTQLLLAYSTAGAALGFDGAALLADVVPSAPFDPTVAIRPGEQSGPTITRPGRSRGAPAVREDAVAAAAELLARAEGLPRDWNAAGSNWWVVSGQHSSSGSPLLASDPHLSLSSPPVFHELHLDVSGGPADRLNVYGATFPGVPGVVLGFNERIMWGATVNPLDVTDFFQEQLVISGGVPVAAVHEGVPKPLEIIPEQFRVSEAGTVVPVPPGTRPSGLVVPPATFVLPWRSDGPLVSIAGTTGISVQYTGFGPTRELETFLRWNRGRNLADFREGLRFFDVGSQNWGYADVDGNIAYFTSAEMPLRADLQAGTVVGLPPWFVRSGAGPNDWIPQPDPPADQATPFQILPAEEMPHLVNPERGWIANANNDPIGTSLDNDPINQLRPGGGIYYLSPGYAIGNRAGRVETLIEEALAGGGTLSPADMARIQADVIMRDAEVLAPHVVAAFQAASTPGAPPPLAALAADPGVAEAAGRLAAWSGTTPTGIAEGFDASDEPGMPGPPSPQQVEDSVAATIYSVWRARAIANVVDAQLRARGLGGFLPGGDRALVALRRLLEGGGVGASGIDFFAVPALPEPFEVRRDLILLQSLREALDALAGAAFAPAFGGSADQGDYRWGRLHRVVFAHPLGGPFSIPTGAGFPHLDPALPGIPTDGGFDVVDASGHGARAQSANAFMFGSGPARRFIGESAPGGISATHVIPGGQSAVPGHPLFGSQLGLWLTNDAHPAFATVADVARNAVTQELFLPGR